MREDIPSLAHALVSAKKKGIVLLASASNEGANYPITFPARLKNVVFCIGAADGKGNSSAFNPPFLGEEKYSALGEAVTGASLDQGYVRKDGTSTATPVAAGIVAILIDFSRQFMDLETAEIYEFLRKLFIKMSEGTVEQTYRYLAPWYLFGAGKDTKEIIRTTCAKPAGTPPRT